MVVKVIHQIQRTCSCGDFLLLLSEIPEDRHPRVIDWDREHAEHAPTVIDVKSREKPRGELPA